MQVSLLIALSQILGGFLKNGIKLCVKLTVLTKDPNFVTELSSAVYTDQPSGSK